MDLLLRICLGALFLEFFDKFGFSCSFEGIKEEFESVALHDSVEFVKGECDAVVGDSVLGKVIGTDSFGAISATYL